MPRDVDRFEDGSLAINKVVSGKESLPADSGVDMFRLMVRARAMEDQMIKMSKSGMGYFWIGGPGEEAFNIALGLHVKKGFGPAYDYLHLHYRSGAMLIAMNMDLIEGVRQMAMTRTDVNSMGRNFVGHYARRHANVIPVTSVIEVQYTMAPGTALVQKRHGGDGITIVTGGDAGTAEGDFASCMIWSTRPGNELPVLMVVTNNRYGISTPADTQHAEENIVERGKAFGIEGEVVNGNDPIASWHAAKRAVEYCRTNRRPYLLEARVSRLYGHSSSSGATRVEGEPDCIAMFEHKLVKSKILSRKEVKQCYEDAVKEIDAAFQQALSEPMPTVEDIPKHTYAPSEVDRVYPEDYTGLPR